MSGKASGRSDPFLKSGAFGRKYLWFSSENDKNRSRLQFSKRINGGRWLLGSGKNWRSNGWFSGGEMAKILLNILLQKLLFLFCTLCSLMSGTWCPLKSVPTQNWPWSAHLATNPIFFLVNQIFVYGSFLPYAWQPFLLLDPSHNFIIYFFYWKSWPGPTVGLCLSLPSQHALQKDSLDGGGGPSSIPGSSPKLICDKKSPKCTKGRI